MGSVTEWIASERPTIIYGAGNQAAHVYEYCILYGKKCVAIMTSADKTRKGLLPDERDVPHAFPDTWDGDKSAVDIIIALGGGQKRFMTDSCSMVIKMFIIRKIGWMVMKF